MRHRGRGGDARRGDGPHHPHRRRGRSPRRRGQCERRRGYGRATSVVSRMRAAARRVDRRGRGGAVRGDAAGARWGGSDARRGSHRGHGRGASTARGGSDAGGRDAAHGADRRAAPGRRGGADRPGTGRGCGCACRRAVARAPRRGCAGVAGSGAIRSRLARNPGRGSRARRGPGGRHRAPRSDRRRPLGRCTRDGRCLRSGDRDRAGSDPLVRARGGTCAAAGLDPWGTLASGTLLAGFAPEREDAAVRDLANAGHRVSVIGRAESGRGVALAGSGPLVRFDRDELNRM